MGQFDLASALTIDCCIGLCFYGHSQVHRVQSTPICDDDDDDDDDNDEYL